jgi:arsenate reductase-like glutaredoxin family protein
MPKTIHWLYARKHCETCKKAAAHRDAAGVVVKETVDAAKVRFGPEDALALLKGVDALIATKGTAVHRINLKKDRPEDEVLTALMIGPTGNLRAPTARIGRTLVVGFREEVDGEVLT